MLKSIIPLSIATSFSRLSGFARDYVLAQLFLTGPLLDLFFVLFRFPQYTRRFFAEGSLSQALLPPMGQHFEKNNQKAVQSLYAQTFWFIIITLGSFSLSVVLFPQFWIYLLAPGFDALQQQCLMDYLPFAASYALCLSFISLYALILQLHNSYWLNGLSPMILNVALIISALAFKLSGLRALIGFMLLAGVVQVVLQASQARQYLDKLIPPWPVWTSEFSQVMKNFIELSPLALIILFNTLFDQRFLTFTDAGEMSVYYLSERIIDLPVGVLGYSIYSVFSGYYMRQCQDPQRRGPLESRVLFFVFVFVLPAAGAIAFLAPQIMRLFVPLESQQAHAAVLLRLFSLNIVPIVLNKIFVIVLNAHGQRRHIVQAHLYGMGINALFDIALFPHWQGAGVALSTSLTLILQLLIFERLYPLVLPQLKKISLSQAVRPLLAMVLALTALSSGIGRILIYDLSPWVNITAIGGFAVLIGVVYLLALWPLIKKYYQNQAL